MHCCCTHRAVAQVRAGGALSNPKAHQQLKAGTPPPGAASSQPRSTTRSPAQTASRGTRSQSHPSLLTRPCFPAHPARPHRIPSATMSLQPAGLGPAADGRRCSPEPRELRRVQRTLGTGFPRVQPPQQQGTSMCFHHTSAGRAALPETARFEVNMGKTHAGIAPNARTNTQSWLSG